MYLSRSVLRLRSHSSRSFHSHLRSFAVSSMWESTPVQTIVRENPSMSFRATLLSFRAESRNLSTSTATLPVRVQPSIPLLPFRATLLSFRAESRNLSPFHGTTSARQLFCLLVISSIRLLSFSLRSRMRLLMLRLLVLRLSVQSVRLLQRLLRLLWLHLRRRSAHSMISVRWISELLPFLRRSVFRRQISCLSLQSIQVLIPV